MRRRGAETRGGSEPVPYELLSDLRFLLREFAAFSESAARALGLTPAQHQALLAIKGAPATTPLSVGDLARRLILRHHSAVGLVDRLLAQGLVRRRADPLDRRRVILSLTKRGESLLGRLSTVHHDELRRVGPHIESLLSRLRAGGDRAPRASRRKGRPAAGD